MIILLILSFIQKNRYSNLSEKWKKKFHFARTLKVANANIIKIAFQNLPVEDMLVEDKVATAFIYLIYATGSNILMELIYFSFQFFKMNQFMNI